MSPGKRYGISLGRPLGIPVYLAPSWLVLGALITWSQAGWVHARFPATSGLLAYAVGALTATLLALSVLAHELGHSAVSTVLGIPIRRITLFLLGGVAEISREPETPAREYLVAVAGPLVSVSLAGTGFAISGFEPHRSLLALTMHDVAVLNLTLALLNLLPGLPLDGGRLLRAVLWARSGHRERSTRTAYRFGLAIALSLAGLGVLGVVSGSAEGVLPILVGMFIWTSASTGLRRSELVSRLSRLAAWDLASPALCVHGDLPLAEAVRRADAEGSRLVVVDSYGAPDAVISEQAIARTPVQRWPWVPVSSVARRIVPGLIIDADLSGTALLAAFQECPAHEYLVVGASDGRLGVLTRRDAVRLLNAMPAQ